MDIAQGFTDINGALGALQSASNIIKTFAGLRSDSERSAKLIELQSQIMAAQTSAIQANAAQTSLIERIRDLEEKIASLETWTAEKQRYELTDVGDGSLAYAVKEGMRGTEPHHKICAHCYQHNKKSHLQPKSENTHKTLYCPECKTSIYIGWTNPLIGIS